MVIAPFLSIVMRRTSTPAALIASTAAFTSRLRNVEGLRAISLPHPCPWPVGLVAMPHPLPQDGLVCRALRHLLPRPTGVLAICRIAVYRPVPFWRYRWPKKSLQIFPVPDPQYIRDCGV